MTVNSAAWQGAHPMVVDKRTLGIVFFTVFLDLIGFGILIPIQPFYAESLGASPALVTLLGASFSFTQFLFAPFWGSLSDRIGRRPVMLMSILIASLGYLAFGLSHTLTWLFISRMVAGFGSANIGTAQAIIADCTPPESRAKGMALIGVAFGLGFILGPALGGLLVKFGLNVPIFVASALCALNFCIAFVILPETRKESTTAAGARHGFMALRALGKAAKSADVANLFFLFLAYAFAFSMMEQVLGLFIERSWSLAGADAHAQKLHAASLTTYVLLVVGVTSTLVQGGLIGRLVKKFGERRVLVAGLLSVSIGLSLIPLSGNEGSFSLMLVTAFFIALGAGLTNPSLTSLLSRSVSRDEQGEMLGVGQSLSALGRIAGPTLAGVLFQVGRGVPFWLGAAVTLFCGGVAWTVGRHPKTASV